MNTVAAALADPVRVGLVGAGRIGTSHATLLARHVPVVITAASPAHAGLVTAAAAPARQCSARSRWG
jgi:myo-inositol 2-dehydrogenase/D-chiro-inositol 1-dehydrogenase